MVASARGRLNGIGPAGLRTGGPFSRVQGLFVRAPCPTGERAGRSLSMARGTDIGWGPLPPTGAVPSCAHRAYPVTAGSRRLGHGEARQGTGGTPAGPACGAGWSSPAGVGLGGVGGRGTPSGVRGNLAGVGGAPSGVGLGGGVQAGGHGDAEDGEGGEGECCGEADDSLLHRRVLSVERRGWGMKKRAPGPILVRFGPLRISPWACTQVTWQLVV